MDKELSPYDFYLLRTPLLPVESVIQSNADGDRSGRDGFAAWLTGIFSAPQFREAIYTASTELHQALLEWLTGKMTNEKKEERLLQTLYKYYQRMSTRCTPYGLFAGCTAGAIGGDTTDILFARDKFRQHSRLDMNYVAELAEYITGLPHIRAQIRFFPSNTLYKVGDKYRYVEFTLKNKRRSYHVTSVSESVYTRQILERASGGATISELALAIAGEEVSAAQAEAFVNSLIGSQLLISEFEPTVTGDEFFGVLIEKLKQLRHTDDFVARLEEVAGFLRAPGEAIGRYQRVAQIVKEFIPTSSKDLVQTDLFFNTEKNTISRRAVDHLLETSGRLLKAGKVLKVDHLEEFKKRFYARFENQEVPLLVALDAEAGVGYALNVSGNSDNMPLVGKLALPGSKADPSVVRNKANALVLAKMRTFIESGQPVVQLTDEEIDSVAEPGEALDVPDSLFLFGNLLSPSGEELDKGNYKFVLNILGGPSAGSLLGRFCHGIEGLAQQVEQCLREEEQQRPEAIFAELVHLPYARTGNVLMRPQLRQYEIPYLGKASVPEAYQIPLEDLLVSIQGDRIRLRSKRLNKEVIPRLTSAHNPARGLTAYHFLGELQFQDTGIAFAWQWGVYGEEPYLPRVEYRNFILCRARWSLKKDDYLNLNHKDLDLVSFFGAIRKRWNIPRYTVIQESDNELLVDFESAHSLENLADALRKGNVTLLEYLCLPDQCFVKDEKGSYANEIVIPIKRVGERKPAVPLVAAPREEALLRKFIPGSEWLYVKVYTGNKTADYVLTEYVKPLTERLRAEGVIEEWFFIRYQDPDPHLRLRFHHGSRQDFWAVVLAQLYAALNPLIQNGMVVKVLTDTYQREIERYGASTMALSEALFCSDSVALAEFLDLIGGDEGERYRWLFALRNVDALLDDFGLDLEAKDRLLRSLQSGFYAEFNRKGKNNRLLHSLNDKYRAEAKAIEHILGPGPESSPLRPAADCFRRRSERNRRLVAALEQLREASPETTLSNAALLPSYIHMTLNRTFIARQRMHELVVYHYLSRYYESALARRKAAHKRPAKDLAAVASS